MRYRPQSAYFLRAGALDKIYSQESQKKIGELTIPLERQLTCDNWQDHTQELRDVKFIMSGWGMAVLDEALLGAAPELKHVFYGSGSIRDFYTDAARKRGISVSSAWRANAIPTAEFAHATIILSLKKFWRAQRTAKADRIWTKPKEAAGIYKSTIGIVSLGAIGSQVATKLVRDHNLEVIAFDPLISPTDAALIGVRLVTLEELFATSDVISLHCPSLPETVEMITRQLLESMVPNATLINTARGELIDEVALIDILKQRTDIDAILDVTTNEYCNEASPLWDLPNAIITPHIAGSINRECQRMGEYMVDELERLLTGLPLKHEVTDEIFSSMA